MALVRAVRRGVGPHGGKIKPGEVFEHAGPLASWMELVGNDTAKALPSSPSKIATEEPAPEQQSEAAAEAPAAESNKRQLRNRKPAQKEEAE
jgi:hypothetical protein